MTHSFRRPVVIGLAALTMVGLSGGSAMAAGTVTPTLQCVFHNADGSFTGVFGYTNSSATAVTLPVGGSNTFAPNPADRGQPTVFQPGSHPSTLLVDFTVNNLAWNLDTHNVHATNTSTQCASDPTLGTDLGSVPAIVVLGAMTLLAIPLLRRPSSS